MSEATVTAGQPVALAFGWGACTRGLTQAFARQAHVEYTIDGTPVPTPDWTEPEPGNYSSETPCVNGSHTGWVTRADYVTTFGTGTYTIGLSSWMDHPFTDGGDYDGDGQPDLGTWMYEGTMTLYVVPAG